MNREDLERLAKDFETYINWQLDMAHQGVLEPRIEDAFVLVLDCIRASIEFESGN